MLNTIAQVVRVFLPETRTSQKTGMSLTSETDYFEIIQKIYGQINFFQKQVFLNWKML